MSSNFKNFISGKTFLALGSLLLIFMLSVVFRQIKDKRSVQKEISDLSGQAQSLQQKNADLKNLLNYLQTDAYKQKAAREQLALKRPGEVVYTFAPQDQANGAGAAAAAASGNGAVQNNPKNWWNYFFNPVEN